MGKLRGKKCPIPSGFVKVMAGKETVLMHVHVHGNMLLGLWTTPRQAITLGECFVRMGREMLKETAK